MQAGISLDRYIALERGKAVRGRCEDLMVLNVAERLGMESVRVSYSEEFDQYEKRHLSRRGTSRKDIRSSLMSWRWTFRISRTKAASLPLPV